MPILGSRRVEIPESREICMRQENQRNCALRVFALSGEQQFQVAFACEPFVRRAPQATLTPAKGRLILSMSPAPPASPPHASSTPSARDGPEVGGERELKKVRASEPVPEKGLVCWSAVDQPDKLSGGRASRPLLGCVFPCPGSQQASCGSLSHGPSRAAGHRPSLDTGQACH